MPHRAGRNELKPAQRLALSALNDGETGELTREQYQQLAGVSRSQAAYDLAELVERGVVERVGGGRSTRYRLARRSQPSQRHWTNERIRAALVELCAGRKTWPSAGDFKTAGHTDLYVAASRYGGIGFWASELGFERPGRAAQPQRRIQPMRPRLRWAAAGAALAAVLFTAAGAVLYPRHGTPARNAAGRQAEQAAAAGRTNAGRHAPAAASKQTRTTRRSTHRSTPRPSRQNGGSGYHAQLAVQRASTATHVVSRPRQTPAQPSTSSRGPAPLPPPPGSGTAAPAPLPPPQG
jgi:hypothetical protein